jgi:hypothetical protein
VGLICAKPIFIAAEAAYARRQNRQYVLRRSGTRPRVVGGALFVAGVQRVIRSFDENLTPLEQSRCEKAEYSADNNFLHECRVHAWNWSTRGATAEAGTPPRKLQIPSSKLQRNSNNQPSKVSCRAPSDGGRTARFRGKLQTPNPMLQRSTKTQSAAASETFPLSLEFVSSLALGAWMLALPASAASLLLRLALGIWSFRRSSLIDGRLPKAPLFRGHNPQA